MPEEEQPEEKTQPEGKRQAVVVGINDYHDSKIPKLTGAVNDAKDICQRLKDFGKFEVANHHFLLDADATCRAIRLAISDLLWQADPCDLALFYFSGHGFVDGHGNGYIAPYDMLKDEPLVYGINMGELKQVILDSVNKSIVLMILDCCHSGITTKGDKSIPDVNAPYDPYFGNLNNEEGGEGKIIIASSEKDQVSREIPDCKHVNGGPPHNHGTFTFHLIEGLDGKASDRTGIITLSELWKYVEDQIEGMGKQKPKFFAANASRMSAIKIAVASQKYNEYIQKKIKEAGDFCRDGDLPSLMSAIPLISDVLNIDEKNENAINLKIKICEDLIQYQEHVDQWLTMNEVSVRPSLPHVFLEFDKLVDYLHFEKITTIGDRKSSLLLLLWKVSKGEITKDKFIKKCDPFDILSSTPKIIGTPKK